jgi:hypothetical protein
MTASICRIATQHYCPLSPSHVCLKPCFPAFLLFSYILHFLLLPKRFKSTFLKKETEAYDSIILSVRLSSLITLNQSVDFTQRSHAIEGDFDTIFLNPLLSTIQKWRTFNF